MDVFVTLILLAFAIFVFFLPTYIALKKGHHNQNAIIALNILLGWTFLGWVGALIWSLTESKG